MSFSPEQAKRMYIRLIEETTGMKVVNLTIPKANEESS